MANISVKTIQTCMGKVTSFGQQLDYLTEEEKKELDVIGYTGKNSQGVKTTREHYLNSLDKGQFKVEQTKFDNGDFTEKFIIVRVF